MHAVPYTVSLPLRCILAIIYCNAKLNYLKYFIFNIPLIQLFSCSSYFFRNIQICYPLMTLSIPSTRELHYDKSHIWFYCLYVQYWYSLCLSETVPPQRCLVHYIPEAIYPPSYVVELLCSDSVRCIDLVSQMCEYKTGVALRND